MPVPEVGNIRVEEKSRSRWPGPSINGSRVLSHLVGASNALLVLESTRKLCNIFFWASHMYDAWPSVHSICLIVPSRPSTPWLVNQLLETLQVAVLLSPY